MDAPVAPPGTRRQHLIDPEICIRCNTCEATCPVGAITHDDRNYVVDVDVCRMEGACIAPCPTGAIDNWRLVPAAQPYSVTEQLGWDVLPTELPAEQLGVAAEAAVVATIEAAVEAAVVPAAEPETVPLDAAHYS